MYVKLRINALPALRQNIPLKDNLSFHNTVTSSNEFLIISYTLQYRNLDQKSNQNKVLISKSRITRRPHLDYDKHVPCINYALAQPTMTYNKWRLYAIAEKADKGYLF